ncbi:MAG: epsE 1 [Cyanobacteria bacterium RYN_339]|nr:epsE 1 [Cyanobacteria bacterium RYN_339]
MSPATTVLLPAYQAAFTLEAAIASVLAQTDPDFELLVVDDGSTDGTGAIAAACADPRVRLVAIPHGGIVAALEAGLATARGRYIARMDADDLMRPDRLAVQRSLLVAGDYGLVSCRVAHPDPGAAATEGYARHVTWLNGILTPEDIALNRFVESPLAHPSVLFRRELLERHGGYRDGDFPEDYELWLRWLEADVRMAKAPEVLLDWHDTPGRLSRTDPRYGVEAFYRLKAGYLARWLARHNPAHPDVVVWGSGKSSRQRAAYLEAAGCRITAYVDVDPRRRISRDVPIRYYQEVRSPAQGFIVSYAGRRGAHEFVRTHLTSCGFLEGRDFLLAA